MAEAGPPEPQKRKFHWPFHRALRGKEKWGKADTWAAVALVVAIAGIVVPLVLASGGSGTTNNNTTNNNTTNNNKYYGPTASSDAHEKVVQETGSYTVAGFHDAIDYRETSIVALYLESGMAVTTTYESASIILFGFQGQPTQDGDPVALVKTFQAAGFKVDEELQDSYLMGALTNNDFPLMFNTSLAPKGYTGGYQGGTFIGSLLFWIVQRAAWAGPTDQDIQVIKYLISQGADCKVPLSFLEYNGPIALAGTSPYKELLPMMQSCA